MSDRSFLIDQIKQHKSNYTEESSFKNLFLQLLEEEKCFSRINLSRHITGSAWITDFDREHIVLLHHKKLNKWLQPGGHADGNKDIEHVARKEAMEETGLINLQLAHPTLFDIDIHTIPAKNNVPEHDHYDIRYWFLADFNQTPITNHESNEVKWVDLSEAKKLAKGNKSLMRMIQKTEQHEFIS
jgi:8-oxo-dGTP pyrophosphatase MutT (NUDIX family)